MTPPLAGGKDSRTPGEVPELTSSQVQRHDSSKGTGAELRGPVSAPPRKPAATHDNVRVQLAMHSPPFCGCNLDRLLLYCQVGAVREMLGPGGAHATAGVRLQIHKYSFRGTISGTRVGTFLIMWHWSVNIQGHT